MTIKAPAKINLTLDIVQRLPNGYHELKTVFQAVDLYDGLQLKKNNTGEINITSNSQQIPLDKNNIVYKAVELVRSKHNIKQGVDIYIDKKIPVAAGLAGGSTNAGATLKTLNELWGLELSVDELMSYGEELGMDVPFTIVGGTALGTHFGEKLAALDNKLELNIVIVTSEIAVSTKEAYQNLDLSGVGRDTRKTDKMVTALQVGNLPGVVENLHNDFEKSIIPQHPVISEIKEKMLGLGALSSLMSGSGPSVFGVWEGRVEAARAFKMLKQEYKQVYLVKSI